MRIGSWFCFFCNDARKEVRGVNLGGSLLRAGRFIVHSAKRTALKMLGKVEYHEEVLETRQVSFEMDGKTYEGVWSLERRHRTRERWPWPYKVRLSSDLRFEAPPQFSGKGENSWDCGDDGIYGMGSAELSPAKALGEYIKRVLEYRERYGMPSETCPR